MIYVLYTLKEPTHLIIPQTYGVEMLKYFPAMPGTLS